MNDNEKLIEEAAKAIHESLLTKGGYRGGAEAALAVFEKAHTPTDDEREALSDRLARRLIDDPKQLMLAEGTGALHVALSESIRSVIEDVYADCGDSDPGVLSSNIARRLAGDLPAAILADPGFRRSEVPEPSADCACPSTLGWHTTNCPANLNHPPKGETPEAYAYSRGFWDGVRSEKSEPQGEPSDAQVLGRIEQLAQSEGVMFADGPRGAWPPVDALLDIFGERCWQHKKEAGK